MTDPRRLLAGLPHATTRRVRGRRFFLLPTEFVTDLTRYCVALAAGRQRESLELYAYTAQANHTHANVKDGHAEGELSRLPDFKRDLHRNLACALNAHYDEAENVWAPGSYSNTEIYGQASIEDQLIYLWTQPVKDGLCECPEDWPGFMLLPEDFGKIIFARKPDGAYFGSTHAPSLPPPPESLASWQEEVSAENAAALAALDDDSSAPASPTPRPRRSSLPQIASFRVGVPPGFEGLPIEQVRRYFRVRLNLALAELRAERARRNLTYLGIEQVLAQSHLDSPGPVTSDASINPRVACRGNRELLIAVLLGLGAWKATYRRAYEDLRAGRPARFPPGTWGRHRYPRALPLPRDPPPPGA